MKVLIWLAIFATAGWWVYRSFIDVPVTTSGLQASGNLIQPSAVTEVAKNSSEELLGNGDFAGTIKVLEETPTDSRTDRWKVMMSEAKAGMGEREVAMDLLTDVLTRAPASAKPELMLRQADLYFDQGKKEEGEEILLGIWRAFPESPLAMKALHRCRELWENRDFTNSKPEELVEKNIAMTWLLDRSIDESLDEKLVAFLTRLNQRIFFSPYELKDRVIIHHVKYGEFPSTIAKNYKIYTDRLLRINNMKRDDNLRAGQDLRIITGHLRLRVNRERFYLQAYIDNMFFKRYKVGLGKDGLTPSVVTTISKSLARNPDWTDPTTMKIIPSSDIKNPIGTRWIGLNMGKGYGIHGTRIPESIGTASSNGCVRLLNEDVEELFDWVMTGDDVEIQ